MNVGITTTKKNTILSPLLKGTSRAKKMRNTLWNNSLWKSKSERCCFQKIYHVPWCTALCNGPETQTKWKYENVTDLPINAPGQDQEMLTHLKTGKNPGASLTQWKQAGPQLALSNPITLSQFN